MTAVRLPYMPETDDDWRDCWRVTCGQCAHMCDCKVIDAMIEAREDARLWPRNGWHTDPGGGITCLSYEPRRNQPQLSRQQLRRLARMNPQTLPPVCGGCAASKGTDASQCFHTRKDFDAAVKDRRVFTCHERPGYCGGWVRAVLARAGKRVTG